jgi:hypothetical protein
MKKDCLKNKGIVDDHKIIIHFGSNFRNQPKTNSIDKRVTILKNSQKLC